MDIYFLPKRSLFLISRERLRRQKAVALTTRSLGRRNKLVITDNPFSLRTHSRNVCNTSYYFSFFLSVALLPCLFTSLLLSLSLSLSLSHSPSLPLSHSLIFSASPSLCTLTCLPEQVPSYKL